MKIKELLQGLRAIVAFLTILPIRGSQADLETAANYMPLFPLVGLAIGVIAGVAGLAFAVPLPHLVIGPLTLGVLLLITGLHHTDGLLDFGDGLMLCGTREEKLRAMQDGMTGAGGFGLGSIVILTTALSISLLPMFSIPLAIVTAETTAKSSMVLAASISQSAAPGLNTPFIRVMHTKQRVIRTIFPILFALFIGFVARGLIGLGAVVASFIATWIIVQISKSNFGGITGDVLGAINDISRMVAILVIIAGVK
ncbi:MAG: adenosylcobinamide-GDP ribazoletransferase [Nitrososphaerota archaeon]|nr:adenosylcobinamide-GDP ribazoletransferase [Nitrososphaerota archaeon]